jgi:hypothetical protein
MRCIVVPDHFVMNSLQTSNLEKLCVQLKELQPYVTDILSSPFAQCCASVPR